MAKDRSKFLKWQDIDMDGYIDICDDIEVKEPKKCVPCKPNPLHIETDWKKGDLSAPVLNEKMCHFQVTAITKYKTVVPEEYLSGDEPDQASVSAALELRFQEYEMAAVTSILDGFKKDDSPDSISKVIESLLFYKYDLAPRLNSRLKLLYSVPHDVIYNLPDRDYDEEEEEEEEESPGEIVVEYDAAQMTYKNIRVRKALWLYSMYLKVYRQLGEGNIFFVGENPPPEEDFPEEANIFYQNQDGPQGALGRIFNLEDYGDPAAFTSSTMSDLMDTLESFMNARGLNIPGVGGIFSFWLDSITKMKFFFDDYKLIKLHVWTAECGPNRPIKFNKKRIAPLNAKGAWKDKTAVAYFTKLWPMEASISARIPLPWVEFVEKFTYPTVKASFKDEDVEKHETPLSCVADALADELKELGTDLMDDFFGIGDAIAMKFNQNICRNSLDEVRDDDVQMGLILDPNANEKGNIFAMAQTAAFKKINQDDQIFVRMCAQMLSKSTGIQDAQKAMDEMYSEGFERIKQCGMFDMLMQAIECLLGGLSLEEAMNSILKAALDNMSIENFGELFVGLPPNKQDELDAIIKKKMESGELISIGAPNKPWEKPEVINDERTDYPGAAESGADQSETQRTLGTDWDIQSSQADASPDTMFSLYVGALMEVYSDNFLELMDEINKFPGAQLIAHMIIAMDCPRPPLFNPSFMDFIKSVQLPFCRNITDMRAPRLENPFKWIPKLRDIMDALWEAIKWAVSQAIMAMLMKIFIKVCEMLGDAICKALETVGDIAKSLPAIAQGKTTFTDVIQEALCGPTSSPEQVEDTIVDMMSSLGVGAAAFASRDGLMKFTEDLSASATRKELAEWFLGRPPKEFLQVVDQLLEFEYPEFRSALPNERALARLGKNMGNLMPLDFKNSLEDLISALPEGDAMPANPTLCASPEQLENFANLRCQLLEGRATKEQCDVMYDEMRNGFVQDLGDISNLMQGGLESYMAPGGPGGMPVLVSEPGCDDGLFPYESPAQIIAAGNSSNMALESLRIAYAKDMMGNGGFLTGDGSWGLMNMAMSDTLGNPLTAHHRKVKNNKSYVNFATNVANGGESSSGFFSQFQKSAGFSLQEGQFPTYVGEWLMRQFQNASDQPTRRNAYQHQSTAPGDGGLDLQENFNFNSHNGYRTDRKIKVKWEDLDFNMFWGQGVDLLTLPDFGYNSPMTVDFVNENVIINKRARKSRQGEGSKASGPLSYITLDGDMSLVYHDNAAGLRDGCGLGSNIGLVNGVKPGAGGMPGMAGSQWSYGFNVELYMSDIAEIQEPEFRKKKAGEDVEGKLVDKDGMIFTGYKDTGIIANRFEDSCRIKITELMNVDSVVESPLAENAMEDFEKGELIDLPNWLEDVPLLGAVLQAAINLITLPFSLLFRPASVNGRSGAVSVSVVKNRRFEFSAVDDGLSGFEMPTTGPAANKKAQRVLKWEDFPQTEKFFSSDKSGEIIPQVQMLKELINGSGTTATATDKTNYDGKMQSLLNLFAGLIARNEQAWQYGAKYDTLQKSDLDYVIPKNSGYVNNAGESVDGYAYEAASIVREQKFKFNGEPDGYEWRTPENDDMILGQSRDQYRNGENARVIYLNPAQFGGTYTNPPIHIKPIKYEGWMGLVNVWFPEMSVCKPATTELVDFGEVSDKVNTRYPTIPEDKRLKQDEDCAFELPYNRILSRVSKAGLQRTIEAAVKIYASTHFLKAIPTFSLVTPKFPENYSSVYSAYIVEQMEEGFKDAQPAFWEYFSTFKDEEFWYAFLEMSVQYYGYLLDSEEIIDPPDSVVRAIQRLNNGQETYNFPWSADLLRAKATGDAGTIETLSSYRGNKNLEFVRATEEDAKLVLKELVNMQLEVMGDKLNENLGAAGFKTKIWDLDWWMLMDQYDDDGREIGSGLTAGGEGLHVYSPEIVEYAAGVPMPPDRMGTGTAAFVDPDTGNSWPGPFYTRGKTYVIGNKADSESEAELGDDYVGYYHGHIDASNDVVYMAGEYHSDTPQDILIPMGDILKMGTRLPLSTTKESGAFDKDGAPIAGDIEDPNNFNTVVEGGEVVGFGDVADYGTVSPTTEHMYAIEKYISVNGQKMSYSAAKTLIQSNDNASVLSEFYPGTMETVKNEGGKIMGIKGELGVRLGIEFSYVDGGAKIPVTSVEVDALDLPIGQFQPFGADSKILWCLIYMLKEDPVYKLLMRYIFPIPKILSTLAIYNDMGFLSAIGEVTVGSGDYHQLTPVTSGESKGVVGFFLNAIQRNGRKLKEWIPFNHSSTEKDGTAGNTHAIDGKTPGYENTSWETKSYSKGEGRSWGARSKPGRNAFIDFGEKTEEFYPGNSGGSKFMDFMFGSDDPIELTVRWVKDYNMSGNEGWVHHDDRQPAGFAKFDAMFVTEWDSWDRKLLRNSNSRIKKQFKSYYYSRDFKPGDLDSDISPGATFIKNLRGALLPVPGGGMLPWWQKGRLRSNPYNADGELCSKK